MRLLEPIKVGKIELKNRVMFPPMKQDMKAETAQL